MPGHCRRNLAEGRHRVGTVATGTSYHWTPVDGFPPSAREKRDRDRDRDSCRRNRKLPRGASATTRTRTTRVVAASRPSIRPARGWGTTATQRKAGDHSAWEGATATRCMGLHRGPRPDEGVGARSRPAASRCRRRRLRTHGATRGGESGREIQEAESRVAAVEVELLFRRVAKVGPGRIRFPHVGREDCYPPDNPQGAVSRLPPSAFPHSFSNPFQQPY